VTIISAFFPQGLPRVTCSCRSKELRLVDMLTVVPAAGAHPARMISNHRGKIGRCGRTMILDADLAIFVRGRI
jgi:hypothetical protein